MSRERFDIIVIGGGHAGAEAARVAARGGLRVVMVSFLEKAIGRMSCNPAIGGLAKGHLVKEIDALGGLMGVAADAAGIQFKVLNRSKGPAVQGPRAQCDRQRYAEAVQTLLAEEPHVTIVEGCASSIRARNGRIDTVHLKDGRVFHAKAVIVTTGTFLRALMHSGEQKMPGGRFGEPSAETLSDSLRAFGLELGRLKTGTPPRVLADSADFSRMKEEPGDPDPRPFSILTDRIRLPQVPCYTTHTTETAHDLIRENLHRAPMYSGQINGTGPRYCPSIEDKVVRFSEKNKHLIFVEPEGLEDNWLYLNGISTSLPPDVQEGVVHSIPGLENAVIARYGYAVEYDFVNPRQLDPTLQVRGVQGLYLAGQINGTSGYEEAAAQGLVAGINAMQAIRELEPLVLGRDQAYTGVMIDDLVTIGTNEPYRMFTSRAEHRLLLGCDSVCERLTPIARKLGLIDQERLDRATRRIRRMSLARQTLEQEPINPDKETKSLLGSVGLRLSGPSTIARVASSPGFDLRAFLEACRAEDRCPEVLAGLDRLSDEEKEGVVNQVRYAGYIEKQAREAARMRKEEHLSIPIGFSYERPGLSGEIVEKLSAVRPISLGQAARIPGVTPAAISILRVALRTHPSSR